MAVTGTVPSQCDSISSYNGCLELKCLLNTMQNIASVTCESSKCHFDWHTAISIPSTIPFASNHSFSNSGSFPIAGVATAESEVVKEEKWNKVSNIWSNLFKIWNFWLTILCSLQWFISLPLSYSVLSGIWKGDMYRVCFSRITASDCFSQLLTAWKSKA